MFGTKEMKSLVSTHLSKQLSNFDTVIVLSVTAWCFTKQEVQIFCTFYLKLCENYALETFLVFSFSRNTLIDIFLKSYNILSNFETFHAKKLKKRKVKEHQINFDSLFLTFLHLIWHQSVQDNYCVRAKCIHKHVWKGKQVKVQMQTFQMFWNRMCKIFTLPMNKVSTCDTFSKKDCLWHKILVTNIHAFLAAKHHRKHFKSVFDVQFAILPASQDNIETLWTMQGIFTAELMATHLLISQFMDPDLSSATPQGKLGLSMSMVRPESAETVTASRLLRSEPVPVRRTVVSRLTATEEQLKLQLWMWATLLAGCWVVYIKHFVFFWSTVLCSRNCRRDGCLIQSSTCGLRAVCYVCVYVCVCTCTLLCLSASGWPIIVECSPFWIYTNKYYERTGVARKCDVDHVTQPVVAVPQSLFRPMKPTALSSMASETINNTQGQF